MPYICKSIPCPHLKGRVQKTDYSESVLFRILFGYAKVGPDYPVTPVPRILVQFEELSIKTNQSVQELRGAES